MKITRFRCRDLNGYLNFDIRVNDDITFLIGINGSGKTSILKAAIALISPDIDWLMTTRYKSIELELTHDAQKIKIASEKAEGSITFSLSAGNDKLKSILQEDQYQRSVRRNEEFLHDEDGSIVRIRESRAELPSEPVFEAVRKIPNPIFLGIDRTTLPTSASAVRRGSKRLLSQRRPHATLRAFLDDSVAQAEELAVEAIRRVNSRRLRLAAQLRDDVLLTLFSTARQGDTSTLPRKRELAKYESMRGSLKEAFKVIGIDENRVDAAIEPYFESVFAVTKQLSVFKDLKEVFNDPQTPAVREAFFGWMEMNPRLQLFYLVEDQYINLTTTIGISTKTWINTLNCSTNFFPTLAKTFISLKTALLVLSCQQANPRTFIACHPGSGRYSF